MMIITIDGPVASGKSSVARALAKELGIYYLYTGLLYRAVAYLILQKQHEKDISDEALIRLVTTITPEQLTFIKDLSYDYGKNAEHAQPYLFYKDIEVTAHLYHASLEQPASIVSANKYVRAALLDLQRNIAQRYDVVADGRDCGSVVFPGADYKFFLTADVFIRAERLMLDDKRGDMEKDIEKVKAELEERDARDREREVAPLIIPEGAIIIDNSHLTLSETVKKFLKYIKQ